MGQDQEGMFVFYFFSKAAGDGLSVKLHHIRPHYQSCEVLTLDWCVLSGLLCKGTSLIIFLKVKKHAGEKVPSEEGAANLGSWPSSGVMVWS